MEESQHRVAVAVARAIAEEIRNRYGFTDTNLITSRYLSRTALNYKRLKNHLMNSSIFVEKNKFRFRFTLIHVSPPELENKSAKTYFQLREHRLLEGDSFLVASFKPITQTDRLNLGKNKTL